MIPTGPLVRTQQSLVALTTAVHAQDSEALRVVLEPYMEPLPQASQVDLALLLTMFAKKFGEALDLLAKTHGTTFDTMIGIAGLLSADPDSP